MLNTFSSTDHQNHISRAPNLLGIHFNPWTFGTEGVDLLGPRSCVRGYSDASEWIRAASVIPLMSPALGHEASP